MSAQIIPLRPDKFVPRKPAKDAQTEFAVAESMELLARGSLWFQTQREIVGHYAQPLTEPEVKLIRSALDLLDGGPRG